jgi:hypothetical protein
MPPAISGATSRCGSLRTSSGPCLLLLAHREPLLSGRKTSVFLLLYLLHDLFLLHFPARCAWSTWSTISAQAHRSSRITRQMATPQPTRTCLCAGRISGPQVGSAIDMVQWMASHIMMYSHVAVADDTRPVICYCCPAGMLVVGHACGLANAASLTARTPMHSSCTVDYLQTRPQLRSWAWCAHASLRRQCCR